MSLVLSSLSLRVLQVGSGARQSDLKSESDGAPHCGLLGATAEGYGSRTGWSPRMDLSWTSKLGGGKEIWSSLGVRMGHGQQ